MLLGVPEKYEADEDICWAGEISEHAMSNFNKKKDATKTNIPISKFKPYVQTYTKFNVYKRQQNDTASCLETPVWAQYESPTTTRKMLWSSQDWQGGNSIGPGLSKAWQVISND